MTSVRAPVPEPATSGLERAGKWTAAGGAVLLAGGGVIGLLNGRLNSQLTQRYQEHTLAQSDLSSYHRVHTFNLLANAMFIAGGVAAATGLGLWIAAPDADEVQAGVSGRF